jgi:YesN/AraC family two-component response regulator
MLDEQKYRRYGYRAILDICTLEILFELNRICSESVLFGNVEYNYVMTNSYVKKIIDYLHGNYMKKITSADIESHLNLCYDYANFIYKRITGFTIMNYLNNIRMNRAKDLLGTTSLAVSEIAELVGFTDPQYFSKKFKDFDGRSPSKYKKD